MKEEPRKAGTQITLRVEASYGCNVKVGDVLEPGTQIGNALGTKLPVNTPTAGIVRSVDFNSKDHSFGIVIAKIKKEN